MVSKLMEDINQVYQNIRETFTDNYGGNKYKA